METGLSLAKCTEEQRKPVSYDLLVDSSFFKQNLIQVLYLAEINEDDLSSENAMISKENFAFYQIKMQI